jgi:hypothetical protein
MTSGKHELTEIADTIRFMVAVRRRMRMTGDSDGVELMNRYFKEIDKIDPRFVAAAEKNLVGCGVSISAKEMEAVKASIHAQLGDAQ